MTRKPLVAIRWTVGDVSQYGFEALRLSIWGAWRIFGPQASYTVCYNSVPLEYAQEATGDTPTTVTWHNSNGEVPKFLKHYLDGNMAEGVGWKFAPLRLFPDDYEISLDNDCIMWNMPGAIAKWLNSRGSNSYVFAEDVRACFGQFADLLGAAPRNSGIRGIPPGFDLEKALINILDERSTTLVSELDEQGLQAAALSRKLREMVVTVDEVTICSPFSPHMQHLGQCGAHFVGLNAKQLPWKYQGRPAVDYIREHWLQHRRSIEAMVGVIPNPEEQIGITPEAGRPDPVHYTEP